MAIPCSSDGHLAYSLPSVSNCPAANNDNDNGFNVVERDLASWSGSLPASQGLYLNEYEKDSCGVGFICHVKGVPNHKIVSDARQLLCAMTHRGATGADSRDGDGAGVMTAIPHRFFKREVERDIGCSLPSPGEYAVGNVFFKASDPVQLQNFQTIFTKIASDLGLRVLGWREVPTDGTILGPAASSKEPAILQPFVVLKSHYGDGNISEGRSFDARHFERQLYVLRKHSTHTMLVVLFSMPYFVKLIHYEALSPKDSMSAHYPQRISSIRDSSPHPKYTTIIMTSVMFSISRTSRWSIHAFLQTPSQVGIGRSLSDGLHIMVRPFDQLFDVDLMQVNIR